jgi:hypothetical protein
MQYLMHPLIYCYLHCGAEYLWGDCRFAPTPECPTSTANQTFVESMELGVGVVGNGEYRPQSDIPRVSVKVSDAA